MRGQSELRRVLAVIGARVTQAELAVAKADDKFDQHGNLVDEPTRLQLSRLVESLADEVRSREPTLVAAV